MKKAILILAALILAACGGSDSDSPSGSANTAPPPPIAPTGDAPPANDDDGSQPGSGGSTSSGGGGFNICYSGGLPYWCDNAFDFDWGGDDGSDGGSGGIQRPPLPTLVMKEAFDEEPNWNSSTATINEFPGRLADHQALGIQIDGSVNGFDDLSDWHGFRARKSGFYEFRLCESGTSCVHDTRLNRMPMSVATVNVTFGNNGIMENVDDNIVNGNVQTFWIDEGNRFYAMVNAGNANGIIIPYTLQVVETHNIQPSTAAPNAPILFDVITRASSTVTIDWTPPTDYNDGQVLNDIAGYVIYRSSTEGGPYKEYETIDNPGLSSYTFYVPAEGYSYIVMKTVNSAGIEGDHSNEILVFEESEMPPDPTNDGTV